MKSEKSLPMTLRPAVEEDINFLFSSWLKSYRASNFAKGVSNTVFFGEHHKAVEELLKTSTVLIACNNKDLTDIYGYICAEEIDNVFVVHYIYIKHTYRMFGITKALMEALGHSKDKAGMCTHMTRSGERIAIKYNLEFSPYLALTTEYRNRAAKALEDRRVKSDDK